MYLLSKLLPLLVLPLGVAILMIAVGLVKRRPWLVWLAVVVLWTSSSPGVSGWLMQAVERGMVRGLPATAAEADAIVVLSTGRTEAPGPARVSEWNDPDRFFAGVELFTAGKAPVLVFTGGATPWEPDAPLEGDVLNTYAQALGVPADRILATGRVLNTAEEATAVAALLKARHAGAPRVILVTSAFHIPRAQLLFEQAGLVVIAFPVDFAGTGSSTASVLDFVPTAGALAQTQVALRELYGRLYYRFKPW